MTQLPPIEGSIETFFWMTNHWRHGWPQGWTRHQHFVDHVQDQLMSALSRFGPKISKPYPQLASDIVGRLMEFKAISRLANQVSGNYYSIDDEKLVQYRNQWLSTDDLKKQVDSVGAKIFDDIFAVYNSTDSLDVSPFEIGGELSPASDRFVRYSDNREAYQEILEAVAEFRSLLSKANDIDGMDAQDVEIAQFETEEIQTALQKGVGRPRRLWTQATSTLGWVGQEAAASAVGAAALALLTLIYNFLQAVL